MAKNRKGRTSGNVIALLETAKHSSIQESLYEEDD